jgi:lysophospholipase L1-like esterase
LNAAGTAGESGYSSCRAAETSGGGISEGIAIMKSFRAVIALALAGCAAQPQLDRALPAGSRYVAMGSSFAAGPGLTMDPTRAGGRCMRSTQNYASQLARKRGLQLIDVSCSGAKTDHVLGSWGDIPPQIDAVTADTQLITVTIGGNDLGYIGGLMGASCTEVARRSGSDNRRCMRFAAPSQDDFRKVATAMQNIARQVRQRSPAAKLIFVDYFTVMPDQGGCDGLPIAPEQARASRIIAAHLAAITAGVARENGAGLVEVSRLSHGHDVCGKDPWLSGFSPAALGAADVPYHPNLAGMTAVARALDRMLD